ncbi:DUF1003 domain-containing protein [Brachybacterium sp. JHP9]|uniref:DUF1003 domain-containing protein n=1 Tax=Brachybacterium equifaecis TaxID=2910770 RepID=A0ABT0QXS6_9MICO|nr:DUF1003 domain-containing protein [Brachybacterium equifaecis]MCL6421998.1 DUF1003 domain-containing protein [Brachybacterium equifaecis]
MAEQRVPSLDDPGPRRRARLRSPMGGDTFGAVAESFARLMGTPGFLVGMTLFCAVWLAWNSLAPAAAQFDPRALNFTLLTLILSLQASYAAPLLLLAQNRQDDRDRVQAEQDRQSNERNHATTDFITREIASLRIALNDVATRDFVRGELRDLLEEIEEGRGAAETGDEQEQLRALVREAVREELAAGTAQGVSTGEGPTDRAGGPASERGARESDS